MDHDVSLRILAYLTAAVVAVPLFRKFKLGAILGYLFAGVVIGPEGINFVSNPEQALHIAEIGVVMLLFVIGLELNPEKLWDMRVQISVLGLGQMLLSAAVIAIVAAWILSTSWQIEVLIGLTLALSSTAFAIQLMDEQGVMASRLGRKGFAILLLQDMAVIPILLLVNAWAPASDAVSHGVNLSWWEGTLVVIGVLLFGRFGLNPALRVVASSGAKEVLTAAALLIVLGMALLMETIGLSAGMGAFLAGIMLANSSFRHELETNIEPFKGLLLGLFFIAVGMSLDLQLLFDHPFFIVGMALALMTIKALIITYLISLRDCSRYEGLLMGLILSQGGEFAFVVMAKAVTFNVIEQSIADYIILIVGVSMALTSPAVMLLKYIIAKKKTEDKSFDTISTDEVEVIIAGFGRFGLIVGRILAANNICFTALDKDASHVDLVNKFGNKVFYGDLTRLDLLKTAGIEKTRILVIAIDDREQTLSMAKLVREMFPEITIIARAYNRQHAYQLRSYDVKTVIRETFGSSLTAAEKTLLALGFTEGQAHSRIELFKDHDEQLVEQGVFHKDDLDALLNLASEGSKELASLFKNENKS